VTSYFSCSRFEPGSLAVPLAPCVKLAVVRPLEDLERLRPSVVTLPPELTTCVGHVLVQVPPCGCQLSTSDGAEVGELLLDLCSADVESGCIVNIPTDRVVRVRVATLAFRPDPSSRILSFARLAETMGPRLSVSERFSVRLSGAPRASPFALDLHFLCVPYADRRLDAPVVDGILDLPQVRILASFDGGAREADYFDDARSAVRADAVRVLVSRIVPSFRLALARSQGRVSDVCLLWHRGIDPDLLDVASLADACRSCPGVRCLHLFASAEDVASSSDHLTGLSSEGGLQVVMWTAPRGAADMQAIVERLLQWSEQPQQHQQPQQQHLLTLRTPRGVSTGVWGRAES
jgi:hypothetical protein